MRTRARLVLFVSCAAPPPAVCPVPVACAPCVACLDAGGTGAAPAPLWGSPKELVLSVRVLAGDLGPELMAQAKPTLRFADSAAEADTAPRLLVQARVAPELDSLNRKVILTVRQGKHVTTQAAMAGQEDADLVPFVVERRGCEPMSFALALGRQHFNARLDFVCP